MAKKQPQTLSFLFTTSDPGRAGQDNPHAKSTTEVDDTVDSLREAFGDDILDVLLYAGERTVYVPKSRIAEICSYLKTELGYTYLADLGGVDRFTEDDRYEVMYNIVNMTAGKRIRLKVRVDEDDLTVPSLTSVYRAADWNERECWDMFGITFDGHGDLRRMFMPEDFEYHPLRKEFPLLGVPGSLPLPPQTPTGDQILDPYPRAHGSIPPQSFEEAERDVN